MLTRPTRLLLSNLYSIPASVVFPWPSQHPSISLQQAVLALLARVLCARRPGAECTKWLLAMLALSTDTIDQQRILHSWISTDNKVTVDQPVVGCLTSLVGLLGRSAQVHLSYEYASSADSRGGYNCSLDIDRFILPDATSVPVGIKRKGPPCLRRNPMQEPVAVVVRRLIKHRHLNKERDNRHGQGR